MSAHFSNENRYLVYRHGPDPKRPGKFFKLPVEPSSASPINAQDPANWQSRENAEGWVDTLGTNYGVGFAVESPYWFLDIDNCVDSNGWSELATSLVQRLPSAYVEISLSGKGLHIIARGTLPPHSTRNAEQGLELYSTARFCALTGFEATGSMEVDLNTEIGDVIADYFSRPTPTAPNPQARGGVSEYAGPQDDDELIRRMLASSSPSAAFGGRASIQALWEADADVLGRAFPDAGDRPYDASSADAALFAHLAWWTGKDAERMERLARRSALVRDKWDREDYISRTVAHAIEHTRGMYRGGGARGVHAPSNDNAPPARFALASDAPEGSEDALALKFAEEQEGLFLYVHGLGQWHEWDGLRWANDNTGKVIEGVRDLCRRHAGSAETEHSRRKIASEPTIRHVETLMRVDRRFAASASHLDADPWLLNTPGGIVDLQSGNILPHDPARRMTKVTRGTPSGACPTWLRFLDRITHGDGELQAYLQRVAGYGLTGSTREHAVFFCHGTGANGKSVFLNTLSWLMGDYAHIADMAVFTTAEQHPTGVAALQGARLVIANETEQGAVLAESRLKQLTGGDPVSARRMRQDPFTFVPVCKIVMAGNHHPVLRNVDAAMRRRFQLVPFTVTISAEELFLTSDFI